MGRVIFEPASLVGRPPVETRQRYDHRDTILYALGVGAGCGPDDEPALRYVYERDLIALPMMAVALAWPDFWARSDEFGIDMSRTLHGEERLELHRPIPACGEVIGRFRITAVHDKGRDRGSLLLSEREIIDAASGERLATIRQRSLLRGNGGAGTVATLPLPPFHAIPVDRPPDHCITYRTRRDQAAIYRLTGDLNPLHVDPAAAASAGFPRPILHGLCTFGYAGRAVIDALLGGEEARLRHLDMRFAGVVFPGETIRFDLWRDGLGAGSFQARVVERDVLVLDNGRAAHDP